MLCNKIGATLWNAWQQSEEAYSPQILEVLQTRNWVDAEDRFNLLPGI